MRLPHRVMSAIAMGGLTGRETLSIVSFVYRESNVKSELYFSNASALRSGIGAPVGFWVGAQ